MKFVEHFTLQQMNSVLEEGEIQLSESRAAELDLQGVTAIYPLIRAIPTDSLTLNYTVYTQRAALEKGTPEEPRGYTSFVHPYAKPVITNHNLEGSLLGSPDVPMGRVIWTGWKRRQSNDPVTPVEGTKLSHQGTGYITMVAAITDPIAIQRILNGQYHSVSIGSRATSVIESISGVDIVAAQNEGRTIPRYIRGQRYGADEKLCYYSIRSFEADEISYVNRPAAPTAHNLSKDIGEAQAQMLLGKRIGKESFKFYDILTKEEVDLGGIEEFAFDESYNFKESFDSTKTYWDLNRSHITEEEPEGELVMQEHVQAMNEMTEIQTQYKEKFDDELSAKDEWTLQDFVTAEKALTENTDGAPEEPEPPAPKTLEEIVDEVLNNGNE